MPCSCINRPSHVAITHCGSLQVDHWSDRYHQSHTGWSPHRWYVYFKRKQDVSEYFANWGEYLVWIFQIAGNLVFASGAQTVLVGAVASNVFWVVSGSVTLQASSLVNGVILGGSKVALTTGASVNGHIFAQSAVTLQKSTVKPI